MGVNGFCKLQTFCKLSRHPVWIDSIPDGGPICQGLASYGSGSARLAVYQTNLHFLFMCLFVLELSAFLGSIPHNISFKLNILTSQGMPVTLFFPKYALFFAVEKIVTRFMYVTIIKVCLVKRTWFHFNTLIRHRLLMHIVHILMKKKDNVAIFLFLLFLQSMVGRSTKSVSKTRESSLSLVATWPLTTRHSWMSSLICLEHIIMRNQLVSNMGWPHDL